jgi:uncharacterized protein with beta-barrel porin domain
MRSLHTKLLYAVGILSITMMAIPGAEALTNIPNGATVTAPPQADDLMNFEAPAPGGTFIIQAGVTFTGAITTTNPGVPTGTLVLNSGSTLNGAVTNTTNPLLNFNLNGNATVNGAITSQNFNLGQNTATVVGALNLPSGVVINTRVISNALFGHIADTGANSIAGASVQVNVDASGVIALTPGEPLFVVSAQGTTSGLPVNVTSNSVLWSFIGNNLNGNITITPTFNPAVIPPVGGGGVGTVFTELLAIAAANPGSDIAAVVAAISALSSVCAIQDALLQLDPNVEGALPQVSFQANKQFTNMFSKHMGYGRCVYATECDEDCVIDVPRTEEQLADCELKKEEGCFSAMNCKNVENRYEVWGDGFGHFGHGDSQGDFTSYNSKIYGGMLGFQAPLNQVMSLGLGGGYAHSNIDRRHGGDSTIHTYDGTLYASYDPTHWYVDTALSFDWHRYHDKRRIEFPGIDRTAKARYNGQEYSGVLATGYRFYTKNCATITPLASLQYSYLHVSNYHEHGAGDLNLHVESQQYHFLESSLGLKLARPVQTKKGAFVPEVHALWLHDFFKERMDLDTTFSGVAEQAGSFETKGPRLDRDYGDLGAGITFITCKRLAIQLVYNYQFGKHYHANEGLLKISKRF